MIAGRIADRLRGTRARLRARVTQDFTWEGVHRKYLRPLVEQP
jgi:hypothetical protein